MPRLPASRAYWLLRGVLEEVELEEEDAVKEARRAALEDDLNQALDSVVEARRREGE